jgi:hypothetical protein
MPGHDQVHARCSRLGHGPRPAFVHKPPREPVAPPTAAVNPLASLGVGPAALDGPPPTPLLGQVGWGRRPLRKTGSAEAQARAPRTPSRRPRGNTRGMKPTAGTVRPTRADPTSASTPRPRERPRARSTGGIAGSEAEGEGFEPSVDRIAHNGFRDRPVQPLRHPSERPGRAIRQGSGVVVSPCASRAVLNAATGRRRAGARRTRRRAGRRRPRAGG